MVYRLTLLSGVSDVLLICIFLIFILLGILFLKKKPFIVKGWICYGVLLFFIIVFYSAYVYSSIEAKGESNSEIAIGDYVRPSIVLVFFFAFLLYIHRNGFFIFNIYKTDFQNILRSSLNKMGWKYEEHPLSFEVKSHKIKIITNHTIGTATAVFKGGKNPYELEAFKRVFIQMINNKEVKPNFVAGFLSFFIGFFVLVFYLFASISP